MLHWRMLLSAVFVPALFFLCWLDLKVPGNGLVMVPFWAAVCILASQEFFELLSAAGLKVNRWVLFAGSTLVIFCSAIPHWWPPAAAAPLGVWGLPAIAFALGVSLAFWDGIQATDPPAGALQRFAFATVGIAYIGWLSAFLVHTLWLGPAGPYQGAYGLAALGAMIIIVKLGDVGAYTVGRMFGRTKLAPRISPGKTVEGALGGILFSAFGAWLVWQFFGPWFTGRDPTTWTDWPRWLAFAVTVNLAGTLGDLGESLVKRGAGRKDSSRWMPGFGGVLDLIDSVLVAGPVAYAFWAYGWISL